MENNENKGGKKILSLNKKRTDRTLMSDHIKVTLTSEIPNISEKFKLSIQTVSPDVNILLPAHTPDAPSSRQSVNTLSPVEKRARKEQMIKDLAKYSSMESGGSVKDFQKLYAQWDDNEVEAFLKSGRFDKYIQQNEDAEVVGSADAHAILRGMKQYREDDLAEIESEQKLLQRLTGALVTDDSQDDLFVTNETLITGKIYAQGLGGEFMAVMGRHSEWKDMSEERRKQAFTKEERAIFAIINKLGLDPSLLTGEYAGDVLGAIEEESNDTLTVIESDLGDRKNPRRQIANIFGHFHRDVKMEEEGREHVLTSHVMDIMPLNQLSNEDFYEREFTLGSVDPDLPDYMQNTINYQQSGYDKKFKSTDPFQQQLNVLGLSTFSTEDDFFKVLAARYIDPNELENLGDRKDEVISNMAGVLGVKMRENIKQIAVTNAMIMQENADNFKALVNEVGIEKARSLFEPKDVTPYAAAYPEFSELVDSGFNDYLVKDGLDKKGHNAPTYEADLMSTLIGKGLYTIPYNKFDDMDMDYKQSLIERGAFSTIPKLIAKTYGYGDAVVHGGIGRRDWEGGFMPTRKFLEDDPDGDIDRHRKILAKIEANEPLDRYDREFMGNFVNIFFQPKGDLSPDWEDPNLTYVDEYVEFANEQISLAEDEEEAIEEEEEALEEEEEEDKEQSVEGTSESAESTPAFDNPSPLDGLNEREQNVDNRGTGPAPNVNVSATQTHTDTSGTNKTATGSAQFVLGDFIRQASAQINMGRDIANKSASEGSRIPVPDTREARLAAAREDYLKKNPFVKEHAAKQGTDEWLKAREGLPTASEAWRFTAGDRKANEYLQEKAREGWGLQARFEGNADTARGSALEDRIRKSYEAQTDTEVLEMGLLTNSLFPGGASLDGIVTKDGQATNKGVEFKAPREFGNPNKYRDQMQMQMAISGLEEIDLVQGVEVNRVVQTKTSNFKADKEWQENNKEAIQEVKDALAQLKGMSQEEFLAANAEMAKDKSNKYPYLMRSKEVIDTEELAKKGSTASEPKVSNAWRRGGVSADPTDAPTGVGGNKPPTISGGFKKSDNFENSLVGSIIDKAERAYKTVEAGVNIGQDFSQDWIGPALDAGMNPGMYLSNTLGMKGQGLTDKQARNATATLSNAYGDMQMGDFSTANQMVRDSLGYIDYDDIEMYAQDPSKFFQEMDNRTGDLSSEAKASLYRKLGMEGANRLSSGELLSDSVDINVQGDTEHYRKVMLGAGTGHTLLNNKMNMGINAGVAGFSEAVKRVNVDVSVELKGNGISIIAKDRTGKQVIKEYSFGSTTTN